MTTPDLPAGPELDRLVAEKVLGLTRKTTYVRVPCPDNKPGCAVYHAQEIELWGNSSLKPYSADIAYAWEVVEKLIQLGRGPVVRPLAEGSWMVTDGKPFSSVVAYADTAPLAISRAALAAVGATT